MNTLVDAFQLQQSSGNVLGVAIDGVGLSVALGPEVQLKLCHQFCFERLLDSCVPIHRSCGSTYYLQDSVCS